MPTDENAQNAYAGESQANRKYSVFAEKAAAEGYPTVGKLFRAASEAEAIHAKRLLFILNAVGSTEENLKGAMEGENHEFMEMYPPFVAEAKKERKNEAAIVFTHAMKAEEVHANLYLQALEAVREGNDLDVGAIYLCPVCGNIEIGAAPEKCPICGVPARMFREIQ
ncbi:MULTISPECIES: rubrerythrin family protein [unclassified Methanoculleus]|uniref:rubrerythrin family protein n=1 Tax=unclassified Methanoculleus TaxID=2619537 RepID=UPI0025ED96D0|nr:MULTISPECIES: rubrerythrin family protein [unclassified Methanoculleus]MCK9318544.1 rubrerythrin family protein [Methanoculleus sp.]MDD2254385.1 rubrerythrin family protein [Methanoculleus sp.]MDD2788597.1 rubrerythrin family protein [Methanoculleus sp.]MDD3215167.1 rubrerythrin family protein [Methanoculleus sp.]MDD4314889.1 rubrerythrin family protein [Methanoculleus sp.]